MSKLPEQINLCYGAFLKVLRAFKKKTVNQWQLHNRLMNIEDVPFGVAPTYPVGKIARKLHHGIDQGEEIFNPSTVASDFVNCKKPETLPIQRATSERRFAQKFLSPEFHQKILEYVETEILIHLSDIEGLVKALIEMLSLTSEDSLAMTSKLYIATDPAISYTKDEIINIQTHFNATSLVAGIFHYIVQNCTDNTVGNQIPVDGDNNRCIIAIKDWVVAQGFGAERTIFLENSSSTKCGNHLLRKEPEEKAKNLTALTADICICVLTSFCDYPCAEKTKYICNKLIHSLNEIKLFKHTVIEYVFSNDANYNGIMSKIVKCDLLWVIAEKIDLIPSWIIGVTAFKIKPIVLSLENTDAMFSLPEIPTLKLYKVSNIFKYSSLCSVKRGLGKAIEKTYNDYMFRERLFFELWFPASTKEITIVASPADEKLNDANMESRNYALMDNIGDRDAVLEIIQLLSKHYPYAHISLMETSKFLPSMICNNLVIIGGPGGNEYVTFDGHTVNDEGNKICRWFSERFKTKISYTNDCETMVVENKRYTATYDGSLMKSDYGYFAAINNPTNSQSRVILIHGIHTLGVVGAAKAFSSDINAEGNYRTLHNKILNAYSPSINFEAFFKVEVFNGQAFCPQISLENILLL